MTVGRIPSVEGGIQPTIFDAKGDLLTATANDTPARLAVGTNGQYLKADSTASTGLSWATLPASGKVLQVVSAQYSTSTTFNTGTLTDSGLTATITPSSTTSKIMILTSVNGCYVGADGSTPTWGVLQLNRGSTGLITFGNRVSMTGANSQPNVTTVSCEYLDSPSTTSATTYKVQTYRGNGTSSWVLHSDNIVSTIMLLEIGA